MINEFIWLVLFSLFGVALGTCTGLIPGLHVNNVAMILFTSATYLLLLITLAVPEATAEFGLILLSGVIVATSITHTFVNFIPTAFIGAPECETALNLLPAHQLLLEGRGYEAVVLSAVGSFGAILLAFILLLPYKLLIGAPCYLYDRFQTAIVFVLIAIVVILIYSERRELPYKYVNNKWHKSTYSRTFGVMLALALFLLSGIFGLIIFDLEVASPLFELPATSLFPALAGLFGAATLIYSLTTIAVLPPQKFDKTAKVRSRKLTLKSIFTGTLSGAFIGFLPGVTAAHGTILAMLPSELPSERSSSKKDDNKEESRAEEVILTLSAVNTAYAFFALIALFLILRPRTGATIVIAKLLPSLTEWNSWLPPYTLTYLLLPVIIASCCSFWLTCKLGICFAKGFNKLPYRKLTVSILIGLVFMVFIFTGLLGLVIFAVATAIGLIAPLTGIRRSHAMGVILLPIILRFIGM